MAPEKQQYEIVGIETTAYYYYVAAESEQAVQAMIDNDWEGIPNADYSNTVDVQVEISLVKPPPTDDQLVESQNARVLNQP